MKIDQESMNRLLALVSAAKGADEVEARLTAALTYERFDTLVRYIRAHGGASFHEEDSVDVTVQLDGKAYRATAAGPDHVAAVMAAVSARAPLAAAHRGALTVIVKTMAESVAVAQYDIKITRKHETLVTGRAALAEVAERLGANARTVRTKRRFSCPTEDGLCRYDITAVHQLSVADNSADIRYEAEVELLATAPPATDRAKVFALFKAASVLLKLIHGTDYLLSSSERSAVISRYSALTRAGGKFVGPKPVTLEMRHLAEPASGVDSIRAGYTVTDKADGERALVFVDASGAVYLIDDRMTVRATGLSSPELADTLLDAEVVRPGQARPGQPPRLIIACFDAYFYQGKDIRGLPLARGGEDDRLAYLKRATAAAVQRTRPTDPEVVGKEFRVVSGAGRPDDLFAQVRHLARKRDAGDVPYDTDGFIFTPARLAVGASDEAELKGALQAPRAQPFGGGTWDKVFKWKPPEFNSIDFLVRYPEGGDVLVDKDARGDDVLFRAAKLYVGTRASSRPVSLLEYLRAMAAGRGPSGGGGGGGHGGRGAAADAGRGGSEYVARLFEAGPTNTLHVCHLRVGDGGVCRCENGDVINDNTIVEMTYSCATGGGANAPHRGACWRPLRVRRDKTERYRLTGSVSGAANDINTALSVWRSICFPVTLGLLTGETRLDEAELKGALEAASGGLYYVRDRPREQSASLPMIVFHNHWVKRESLIGRFKGHALSLFDVGCGRGGDINKWVDAGFMRVLGVDPVDDNLTNPGPVNEGACARALAARARFKDAPSARFPRMVFLRMDASRVIDGEYIDELRRTDEESGAIARALWALGTSEQPELRALHGFAAQGFDLVSCMFATHYFFDTARRLDAFATNVANQLRPGGHFFGACLDGERVARALAAAPEGRGVVEGRKDGRLLWSITRLFEKADSAPPPPPPPPAPPASPASSSAAPPVVKKKRAPAKKAVVALGGGVPGAAEDPRLGRRIRVFVETIGQPLDEFLVDYGLLREVLARKGLVPLSHVDAARLGFRASTGFFDELYGAMASGPAAGSPNAQVAMQMSDAEKEYSFMHRWFVFAKK